MEKKATKAQKKLIKEVWTIQHAIMEAREHGGISKNTVKELRKIRKLTLHKFLWNLEKKLNLIN